MALRLLGSMSKNCSLVFSITGLHYCGISLHFVDDNYYVRMFGLTCKLYNLPNQQAHNIRDFVNTVLEEFGHKVNEDMSLVSDNEPKMVCAFKDDTRRVGCSVHYINKVLEHGFEFDESFCAGVQKIIFQTTRNY